MSGKKFWYEPKDGVLRIALLKQYFDDGLSDMQIAEKIGGTTDQGVKRMRIKLGIVRGKQMGGRPKKPADTKHKFPYAHTDGASLIVHPDRGKIDRIKALQDHFGRRLRMGMEWRVDDVRMSFTQVISIMQRERIDSKRPPYRFY
jgi:hypothetical protein